jgi:putative methylase
LSRKKKLEMVLSTLFFHPKPELEYESYTLDSKSAAWISHISEHIYGDIRKKSVIDLGCGTGIIAISAAYLGARSVVGVDISRNAIMIAKKNAKNIEVDIDFLLGDIDTIKGSFDVTIMNPPFGSWKRGLDMRFLKKAIEISKIVYSLHKHSMYSRQFIRNKVIAFGGKIDNIFKTFITIPKIYKFHRKKKYSIEVDLYRIISLERKNGDL